MTSRLPNTRCRSPFPLSSAQQRGNGVGFEPVVGNAAANHLAPKRRTFPGFDQPGGDIVCIEILAKITGTPAFGQSAAPAFENADQLRAYRLTGATEL